MSRTCTTAYVCRFRRGSALRFKNTEWNICSLHGLRVQGGRKGRDTICERGGAKINQGKREPVGEWSEVAVVLSFPPGPRDLKICAE